MKASLDDLQTERMDDKQSSHPLVLLGAGASAPAGIPTALGMTAKLMEACQQDGKLDYLRALRAITGALQMGVDHNKSERIIELPDIESVINAALLLGNRFILEFAPFVAAWHPIIEELERRNLGYSELRSISDAAARISPTTRRRVGNERMSDQSILSYINQKVEMAIGAAFKRLAEHLSKNPDGALFRELIVYLTRKLVDVTWLRTSDGLGYLDPLLKAGQAAPMTVITLNYDNAVELRAAHIGVPCETGLNAWSRTGLFSPTPRRGVQLLKLHGSVKWWWEALQDQLRRPDLYGSKYAEVQAGLHYRTMSEYDQGQMAEHLEKSKHFPERFPQLGVLFGGHNKLNSEGPFLELLSKAREELDRHSMLLVIGYSFRDPHINQCIARWLQRDDGSWRVTIVEGPGQVKGRILCGRCIPLALEIGLVLRQ